MLQLRKGLIKHVRPCLKTVMRKEVAKNSKSDNWVLTCHLSNEKESHKIMYWRERGAEMAKSIKIIAQKMGQSLKKLNRARRR